jgi:hypothetical protein
MRFSDASPAKSTSTTGASSTISTWGVVQHPLDRGLAANSVRVAASCNRELERLARTSALPAHVQCAARRDDGSASLTVIASRCGAVADHNTTDNNHRFTTDNQKGTRQTDDGVVAYQPVHGIGSRPTAERGPPT